ncbi:hypothetical protein GCM10020229_27430 [Kitasatospora albolonga]
MKPSPSSSTGATPTQWQLDELPERLPRPPHVHHRVRVEPVGPEDSGEGLDGVGPVHVPGHVRIDPFGEVAQVQGQFGRPRAEQLGERHGHPLG